MNLCTDMRLYSDSLWFDLTEQKWTRNMAYCIFNDVVFWDVVKLREKCYKHSLNSYVSNPLSCHMNQNQVKGEKEVEVKCIFFPSRCTPFLQTIHLSLQSLALTREEYLWLGKMELCTN